MYICPCDLPKVFRIKVDGGSSGPYSIEICKKCHSEKKIQFVMEEIQIGVE